MTPTRQLRVLLGRSGVIRSLGAHDVFMARLIESAGLETVFIGGFGTSASLLGLPDVGLLTLTEMADAVRRMASRVAIPVVADGDTGHGDLPNVVRTVREFERDRAATLATDVDGNPVYLAPNRFNLQVATERWPQVGFHATREHGQRMAHT